MNKIIVEVSTGELLDKISILEIKQEKIKDAEKLKFIKKKWEVDVCREPIHIKYGAGTVDILKRKNRCPELGKTDFCESFVEMKEALLDDGLIFAKGEREDISSDHGRIYCSYLPLT